MSTPAVAVIVAIVAVVLSVVVCRVLTERVVRRRLSTALSRLPLDEVDGPPASTSDELLSSIERSVRAVVERGEASARSEDRLRLALDGVGLPVLVFDDDGALLHANSSAGPFLNARHGDAIVGAAVGDLVAEAHDEGRSSLTIELFGPPRRVVRIDAVRFEAGATSGVVATVSDVTDRVHLEEVRTDLVANISHELKTPVGAIGLLAETIEGETDPAVVARLVTRIGDEAVRLASIVDDLLDLSRIEAFDGLDDRMVRLSDVVDEAVARHRAVADRVGVELAVTGGDDITVAGDRSQLVSALANLVDNAIKYSDPGSRVDIAVELVGSEVELRVSDHGIGIPARDLDRIFERFYRVDQARSRDTGGSGLGLSIVRHVARNHGGRIDVTSRLGEGSTFLMALPFASVTGDGAGESSIDGSQSSTMSTTLTEGQ